MPDILGTAGALDKAREYLGDEAFLIVNGKIITDIDISEVVETHKRSGAIATMVLKPNTKREKFTIVNTSKDRRWVTGLGESARPLTEEEIRDTTHELFTPLMFTGIHIVEPRVFDYVPHGVYSDIFPVFYGPAWANGEKIAAHITDANWFELSTIPRYLDISLAMMEGANVYWGDNFKAAAGAHIRDSVIWDDVTIGENANLYRTIIADGVTIEPGEHFENAAIVRAEMVRSSDEIPEKALKGYIQGENYIVPLN